MAHYFGCQRNEDKAGENNTVERGNEGCTADTGPMAKVAAHVAEHGMAMRVPSITNARASPPIFLRCRFRGGRVQPEISSCAP